MDVATRTAIKIMAPAIQNGKAGLFSKRKPANEGPMTRPSAANDCPIPSTPPCSSQSTDWESKLDREGLVKPLPIAENTAHPNIQR